MAVNNPTTIALAVVVFLLPVVGGIQLISRLLGKREVSPACAGRHHRLCGGICKSSEKPCECTCHLTQMDHAW
jgi:hypothetical protein